MTGEWHDKREWYEVCPRVQCQHAYGVWRTHAKALTMALLPFIDDEPCELDHHGGCQTHDPNEGERECRMAVARRVLGMDK